MTEYVFPRLTDETASYWLTMDTWKPYDAAWLLCGFDPHSMERSHGAFATELCTQMCGDHPDSQAAFRVVELLKSSSKAKRISFPAAPGDVIAWAKAKGLLLPRQFLEWHPAGTEQATGSRVATRRVDARIAAIVRTAQQLGYDPLLVPYGGKSVIKRECLAKLSGDPCRFTADTFKSAWQDARNADLIDVENAETYRGR